MNTRQDWHFDIILCVFYSLSAISSETQFAANTLVLRGGFMCMHFGCEHKICRNV